VSKKEASIELERWPIEHLIPYDLNVKKHDKEQVARIVQAISRFGFDQPIVVDKNGLIIKGHGRRLAAIELGMKTVPVWCRRDLSADEVRAARLADNRVAISDIDPELLRLELGDLDADLSGIFDVKELEFAVADLGIMNPDAFVTDMGAVLEEQRRDMDERTERAKDAGVRVPLSKAFGFKDISSAGQIAIASMMSKAEAVTGLKDAEALVAFAASVE
jgi:ParB-like chromosome segregation protein Spo0J